MTSDKFQRDDFASIRVLFPDIIQRPFLSVYPDTNLFQIATFYAIGPEIYVDGLFVFNRIKTRKKMEKKPYQIDKDTGELLGRIGGKHIMINIINPELSEPVTYFPECLNRITANDIMEKITENEIIGINSNFMDVIEIFRKTKFAFIPLIETIKNNDIIYNKVLAFITVRDFLKFFSEIKKINNNFNSSINNLIDLEEIKNSPVKEISSELISLQVDDYISDATSLMLRKGVRNLGVRDKRSNIIGLINDRNILQLLLSPKLRKSASINQMNINKDQERKKGNEKIITKFKIENNLQINPGLEIKEDTLIKNAAKLLSDRKNPYLIIEGRDRIVTPWDIVMKGCFMKNKKRVKYGN
ncbi:MAG: CBS domain-containing protein [Nitrososphaeraceae archaeon]